MYHRADQGPEIKVVEVSAVDGYSSGKTVDRQNSAIGNHGPSDEHPVYS